LKKYIKVYKIDRERKLNTIYTNNKNNLKEMGKENDKEKKDKEKTKDEFLRNYIEETDVNNKSDDEESFKGNIKSNETERSSELEYFHFDTKDLPLGVFYPDGTKVMVRPAKVKEIQAYSMVDDENFYDIVEKMNDMIASCVRVKYSDGSMGSYLDIKDGDRFYLIFLIRELTFQKGNGLFVKAKCSCGETNEIELGRKSFHYHEMDSDIEPYFDRGEKVFYFETKNDDVFKIAPPNIGIQKSFTTHIVDEYKEKNPPNMSFLKIIPFTLTDRNNISNEGIKKKLKDFQSFEMESFQFVNAAVNKMKFGIKQLKTVCKSCNTEVYTDMVFPRGASGIFVDDNSFDKFIKK